MNMGGSCIRERKGSGELEEMIAAQSVAAVEREEAVAAAAMRRRRPRMSRLQEQC